MNLIYNENKYILKIEKDDISIGTIQEKILKTCSLMIYNIENTEFFLKNGKSFILGSEQCIFKEILSNFIKNNIDEITPLTNNDETINYLEKIDKFIVYDRKRDEKGNVIKNNIIIDNYNSWFEENENLKYLNQSSVYNQPIHQNNNIISLFSNIFENSILNYENDNDYINNLQNSKYCIWIDAHESQGFAIEEALSCNVPLLVWNTSVMSQEHGSNYPNIPCSSIAYWDERCGLYFYKVEEFETSYNEFINKIETFSPRAYIMENLSPQKCGERFIELVTSF
jgi:hypothetical protein